MKCSIEIKIKELAKLFSQGKRMTSMDINRELNTVDSRKMISVLRGKGLPIADEWIEGENTRFKIYYLQH